MAKLQQQFSPLKAIFENPTLPLFTMHCALSIEYMNIICIMYAIRLCWYQLTKMQYSSCKIEFLRTKLMKGCVEKDPEWHLIDGTNLIANCFSLPSKKRIIWHEFKSHLHCTAFFCAPLQIFLVMELWCCGHYAPVFQQRIENYIIIRFLLISFSPPEFHSTIFPSRFSSRHILRTKRKRDYS